ncbi:TPA: hypothetical protein ACKQC2_000704 [Stenotrophomonas maltophilia]
MDAIEKRAQELLAHVHEQAGWPGCAKEIMIGVHKFDILHDLAIAAIAAALTPPDGYVLVPVEPTEEMVEAICTEHGSGGWPQGYSCYAQHLRREHAFEGYRAMLSARPEVP